jgi:hypothetical protein
MAEIDLPLPFSSEFISLIPSQRELVNKLVKEKIITSYAVSLEKGKLWTTIFAASEQDTINIIESFPIRKFADYRISKLAFHNTIGFTLPQFSLN